MYVIFSEFDTQLAQKIIQQLHRQQVNIWPIIEQSAQNMKLMSNTIDMLDIESTISAKDYLIILFSLDALNSPHFRQLVGSIQARNWSDRDITLLPFMLETPSKREMDDEVMFNIIRDENVKNIIKQLSILAKLDFSDIDYWLFENLVWELLSDIGFFEIKRGGKVEIQEKQHQFDFTAKYQPVDITTQKPPQKWLIETKFYQKDRVSIKDIDQLANNLSLYEEPATGLLITNGLLTSVARERILYNNHKANINIRLIDGIELKRLLIQHPHLISKYF